LRGGLFVVRAPLRWYPVHRSHKELSTKKAATYAIRVIKRGRP
jgi:hypothetical protein